MDDPNSVRAIWADIQASRERHLSNCRNGNHSLGAIQTPSATQPNYVRHCCVCDADIPVTWELDGVSVPHLELVGAMQIAANVIRFPAGIFGIMTLSQIRRFMGFPRSVIRTRDPRGGSEYYIIPEIEIPIEEDSED